MGTAYVAKKFADNVMEDDDFYEDDMIESPIGSAVAWGSRGLIGLDLGLMGKGFIDSRKEKNEAKNAPGASPNPMQEDLEFTQADTISRRLMPSYNIRENRQAQQVISTGKQIAPHADKYLVRAGVVSTASGRYRDYKDDQDFNYSHTQKRRRKKED